MEFRGGRFVGGPLDGIRPSKIVCVGRNYRKHAEELGNEVPAEPLIFLKPPSSLNDHGSPIVYPRISSSVNYEGEIGLVIGTRARYLTQENAMSCVLGYVAINDVTARDLQKKDGQFTRGKGFDTFCCVGPEIAPRERVDETALGVKTWVNGALKQNGSAKDLIFPIPVILEFVSRFMTLEPGDLIATGTPEGVGPVQPGDVIRVEVAAVGALENPVVQETL
ncbi:MAG: fumarylacetoacetate hydrolase family protein [Bryobacteraceae bacterium]|nr:fumarylacetoacetate hydrolase family protein [Bryobacteraceae bacterium]